MQDIIYFKERADTKISILSVIYVTSILANLAVGYRYISIGVLAQSGGIFIFPISFIISDIVTEVYGSELAKKLVIYGIIGQVIFASYAYLVVHIPSPSFLHNKEVYYQVFNPYINFALASSISIWIGSKVNIIILSKLSEYIGGKYFALRSLAASTVGEFLVTSISMILANYSKMETHTLAYMIGCCFLIKTIISLIAVWPAALIVHKIENPHSSYRLLTVKKLKAPGKYIKELSRLAWNAKGYIYNLEQINLVTKKASLYYKGTRGIIKLPLRQIFINPIVVSRIKALDAARIGYYYALVADKDSKDIKFKSHDQNLSNKLILKNWELNLIAICRNGKLTIEDSKNVIYFDKKPMDIYRNNSMLERFSSSQALYVGFLAGKEDLSSDRLNVYRASYLRLIK